jgi:hypothetical protein
MAIVGWKGLTHAANMIGMTYEFERDARLIVYAPHRGAAVSGCERVREDADQRKHSRVTDHVIPMIES